VWLHLCCCAPIIFLNFKGDVGSWGPPETTDINVLEADLVLPLAHFESKRLIA
jgi:hypothetical protein